jgi:hypothetical protein
MIELDASTKEEIARLMTGDNDRRLYRTERQLRAFARNAGIDSVTDEVAGGRVHLARLALEGGNSEVSNTERAILRLADPREYGPKRDAYEETLRQLGEILDPEQLQVVHGQHNRPAIVPLLSRKPDARLKDIELLVSLGQVVSDPELAAVAQQRLDEARKCHDAGAYIACIIMLGSLLEGVLLDAAGSRLGKLPKPAKDISLDELINLAHSNSWIQLDARLGSHLIRQHRNFVHPDLQRRVGAPPDADTLSMCWPIVNATLNDLAATAASTRKDP